MLLDYTHEFTFKNFVLLHLTKDWVLQAAETREDRCYAKI